MAEEGCQMVECHHGLQDYSTFAWIGYVSVVCQTLRVLVLDVWELMITGGGLVSSGKGS